MRIMSKNICKNLLNRKHTVQSRDLCIQVRDLSIHYTTTYIDCVYTFSVLCTKNKEIGT